MTERAAQMFAPEALLFVGIAGALHGDIAPGDVVVATRVYSYHSGAEDGPVGPTAVELVDAASDYLAATPDTGLREVSFLGYTDAERAALENALRQHPALRPVDATGRLL